jgi:hypothetical protein
MAVKVHQSKMNMLKNKMAKLSKNESVTTNYNMVKGQTQNKNPTKKLATDYTAVIRNIKTDKTQKEEIEQLDEISPATKASYVAKAKDQIKQSIPYTKKGEEYRDIAKNFIKKREKGITKANEETKLTEDNLVHVSDGSKYGNKPNKKDTDHVMAGVKKHGGSYGGSSDKGAYFKFKSHSDAQSFKKHVDSCPGKSCYADLHEANEAKDPREYDYEGDMAKSQLRSIMANAKQAHDMLKDDTNMAEWVQSKITLAADYISTVADYMQSEVNEDKNDYQRKIEKNNKNFIAASKRQKNPLTNVHTAKTKMKPVKEEEQVTEAFPTVDDAKKRMKDALKSKYDKKKISTGTVYTKKYKEEPEDEKKSNK